MYYTYTNVLYVYVLVCITHNESNEMMNDEFSNECKVMPYISAMSLLH